mmetsp:Transcript_16864/g.28812  ORF Transcript_16864/g.28812 Transcript_16864/m.28812 type:complete len:259 (-) Transcript_16864:52-828(-)
MKAIQGAVLTATTTTRMARGVRIVMTMANRRRRRLRRRLQRCCVPTKTVSCRGSISVLTGTALLAEEVAAVMESVSRGRQLGALRSSGDKKETTTTTTTATTCGKTKTRRRCGKNCLLATTTTMTHAARPQPPVWWLRPKMLRACHSLVVPLLKPLLPPPFPVMKVSTVVAVATARGVTTKTKPTVLTKTRATTKTTKTKITIKMQMEVEIIKSSSTFSKVVLSVLWFLKPQKSTKMSRYSTKKNDHFAKNLRTRRFA